MTHHHVPTDHAQPGDGAGHAGSGSRADRSPRVDRPSDAGHADHTGDGGYALHGPGMSTHHTPPGDYVVAQVDGVELRGAEVERVMARMRRGPAAGLLPHDGGAEGRQLRRWLVQLLSIERLIEHTAVRGGIQVRPDHREEWQPDPTAALELGSVLAAVLISSPVARAVYDDVTSEVAPGDDEVAAYIEHNAATLARPETRLVRLLTHTDTRADTDTDTGTRPGTDARADASARADVGVGAHGDAGAGVGEQRLGWVRPDQLAGEFGAAVAGATPGIPCGPVPVGGRRRRLVVDAVTPARAATLAEFGDQVAAELRDAARRHAFVSWCEEQRRTRVALRPGSEHPADPRQPDNTHRH